MNASSINIGIVILGCDKNTVDAEHLAGALMNRLPDNARLLALSGIEGDMPVLDAVVIYTCGFIHDASEESVETILAWGRRRQESANPRRLYVAGCLAQRYAAEMRNELPEVDAFFGVNETDALVRRLQRDTAGKNVSAPEACGMPSRKRLDEKPYAFLKIADGCNHACTFCVIPGIKGRYQSVPRETLLQETQALLDSGVRELNLIAQDTTAYGRDCYDAYRLPDLLQDLCALPGDFWVRCLYCYPGGIDDALVEQIAAQPKIVPYLDIPLQHTSPRVLKAMKRPEADKDIPALITRLRDAIPELVLRTTMMVGFPGETVRDHRHMIEMMEQLAFEWLGAFIFSPENGTPAADMPGQVRRETAARRYDAVMFAQSEITHRFNAGRRGTCVRALIEEYNHDMQCWTGRSAAEAPGVDGCLIIQPDTRLSPGQFAAVKLGQPLLYDMNATVVSV